MNWTEANKELKRVREQMIREEIEYNKIKYPEGFKVGSMMFDRWENKKSKDYYLNDLK